jgi:putative ABC transport system ATP-binding protein
VLEALEQVNRTLGTPTVIITHNADIAGMADRVVHLSNGLIASIETNAVRRPPRELHW